MAELVFVPCFLSPFKERSTASVDERLRLLEIALLDTPFGIWDYEARNSRPSFTIETLREAHRLGAQLDRLYLLVGADAYEGLPRWKNTSEIRDLCRIVVGNRPTFEILPQDPRDIIIDIQPIFLASQTLRQALAKNTIPDAAFPSVLEREFRRLSLNSKNAYAKNPTMQDRNTAVAASDSPKLAPVMSPLELSEYCAALGFEKKAENVVLLDLVGRSTITDYFLIMSAQSQPQVSAIAENIRRKLREAGLKLNHEEGIADGRWAVLDLGDVIVHIFIDYMRDFYNLEGLWREAPRRRLEDKV